MEAAPASTTISGQCHGSIRWRNNTLVRVLWISAPRHARYGAGAGPGPDQSSSPSLRAAFSASMCAWVTRPWTSRVRSTLPMKPGCLA